jgi:hypothetical protein
MGIEVWCVKVLIFVLSYEIQNHSIAQEISHTFYL